MKAHLQGTFLGETFEEGDTLTRSFTLEHPIPTHCAAFAVANYADSNFVHTGEYGDIPVRLTAKPEDINQMVNKFTDIGYAIDALEYWWGPYAWERVGYVLTTEGALEIPTAIKFASNHFSGFVALGCVIRGETSHYETVTTESARALSCLGLEGLCVGNGILTVENYEQAITRADPLGQNKGGEAAVAALRLIKLKNNFT